MKADNTVSQVRESGAKLMKESSGRISVITLTLYSKNKATHGIQFWTPEMIAAGSSVNTDNTVSTFIERL